MVRVVEQQQQELRNPRNRSTVDGTILHRLRASRRRQHRFEIRDGRNRQQVVVVAINTPKREIRKGVGTRSTYCCNSCEKESNCQDGYVRTSDCEKKEEKKPAAAPSVMMAPKREVEEKVEKEEEKKRVFCTTAISKEDLRNTNPWKIRVSWKRQGLLNEYNVIHDVKEALLCMKELNVLDTILRL